MYQNQNPQLAKFKVQNKNVELTNSITKLNKTIEERDLDIQELATELETLKYITNMKLYEIEKSLIDVKQQNEEKDVQIKDLHTTNAAYQTQESELKRIRQQYEQTLSQINSLQNQQDILKEENENLQRKIENLEKEQKHIIQQQSKEDSKTNLIDAMKQASNNNQSVHTQKQDEDEKSMYQSIDLTLNQTFDHSKLQKQLAEAKEKFDIIKVEAEKIQQLYKEMEGILDKKESDHDKAYANWSYDYDNQKKKSENLEEINHNLVEQLERKQKMLSTFINISKQSRGIQVNSSVQDIKLANQKTRFCKLVSCLGSLIEKQGEEMENLRRNQEKQVCGDKFLELESQQIVQQEVIDDLKQQLMEKQRHLKELIEINKNLEKQTVELQEQLKNK